LDSIFRSTSKQFDIHDWARHSNLSHRLRAFEQHGHTFVAGREIINAPVGGVIDTMIVADTAVGGRYFEMFSSVTSCASG